MTFPMHATAGHHAARFRAAVTLLALILCSLSAQFAVADDQMTFENDIRPIFRAHCFDCHGATSELKGGLDLRLVRLMQVGGESGPAIVPGQPDASYLLQRVHSGEMPPGEKKVTAAEREVLARWIQAGAPTTRPEPESIPPGLGVTPEERAFWAFQPIQRIDVPALSGFPADQRIRTPIDAILMQSTTGAGPGHSGEADSQPAGGFAPDADRRVLILRAWFDLLGLPPSPEDVRRWLDDPRPDWFEHLLTELLQSPHYGERWARHWLDVAGYADSEGYTTADAERPWAWKYRDWVIRAINDDMPFDQFITEQLAGDELAGPLSGDLSPRQIELLTATGFLRMAADGTGSGADNPEGRNQVMHDTLKIVGTSLLGLSLHCAQCHDHRYDPIPQADYYALRAVFEPALDWQAWKSPSARLVSLYTADDRRLASEVEAEAQAVAAEKAAGLSEYMQQALSTELEKYQEPLRSQLRAAYETEAAQRTAEQQQLLAQNPSINITPGNLYQYIPDSQPKLAEFDKRMGEIRAKKPVEEFLRALVEPAGHVPETRLFHRGDYQQPKDPVPPGALTVTAPEGDRVSFAVDDEALPTTGRRLAFARWLTSRANPLFARVVVNRIWMHHFGKGLAATPGDFGRLGARPSNIVLLDWLADEFVSSGWSLRHLHRLILSSTAWRMQRGVGSADSQLANVIPDSLQRLDAESLRDRILFVAGRLDTTLYGPPIKVAEDDTGQIVVDASSGRRSLYIQARRSQPVAILQAFDAPVMETNCEVRTSSTVAPQSLMLMNSGFVLDMAAAFADRVAREAAATDAGRFRDTLASAVLPDETNDSEQQFPGPEVSPDVIADRIVRAWQLAFCRDPSVEEMQLATAFVTKQFEAMRSHPEVVPEGRTMAHQSLTNLCQSLLGSNEFLYVE